MHIPAMPTAQLEVLTFQDALRPTGDVPYDRRKWIYIPDHYSEYRYILGSVGSRPLICVGINPSTAAPDHLDNTLKSVERIARANAFDSFIMFNVYAQRATRPDDMEKQCNPLLHAENMKAFAYILSRSPSPVVWAAWGAIIEKRPYLPQCVRDMIAIGERYGAKWCCAGPCSKKGHPHHPLYLKSDAPLRPFDIGTYVQSQLKENNNLV